MSKFRNFTFTFNNYPDTSLVDGLECKYIIYGKEVGKSGTPHLQGVVVFNCQKSEKAVRSLLPGCHVEAARDIQAAILYCRKDGDVTERGISPKTSVEKGDLEQERWKTIRLAAESGQFDLIPEKIRFNQVKTIDYIHDQAQKKRKLPDVDELNNYWYFGTSGTGKSRKARTENPDAYIKMCNKWWDGYAGQDTVILEDFNMEQAKFLAHHLKIWSDHYPFPAEKKGGTIVIRPKRFIVTSNYSLEECFGEDKTGALEPLSRRFQEEYFSAYEGFNR